MTDKPQHQFKVGDEVFIDRNRYGTKQPFELAVIERVTKTQFRAAGSNWKPYGGSNNETAFMVGGGGWDCVTARLATPKLRQENEFRIAARGAEQKLRGVSDKLRGLKDQDAIDAWQALPQSIKDMAQ